ncbi:hypothetical protein CYJ73_16575 [Gordonia terrae]|uniref:Uncharacterized protein n=1 Tax=Gordonia terrae TaxID=2055 RepID=A0A2I1R5S3_9ACTN|nr:hypothetical protein CYJ73_16575 [Gordonia terrae]
MNGYVIEFNRRTLERRVHEFADRKEALKCRFALERDRTDGNWEIASLLSSSLETLQQTHSRYFSGKDVG